MTAKIIIDTDIGTDVDDLWTLAVAVGLIDVDLVAVTVVYGDVGLRARLASLALTGMGVKISMLGLKLVVLVSNTRLQETQ